MLPGEGAATTYEVDVDIIRLYYIQYTHGAIMIMTWKKIYSTVVVYDMGDIQ